MVKDGLLRKSLRRRDIARRQKGSNVQTVKSKEHDNRSCRILIR